MKLSHTLTIDDLVLVERAKGGDERAFAALYRRHVGYVAGILQRLVRPDADEELDDLLQQTFVDAYVGLPRLRNPLGFRPWIARIAARCAYDRLASRRRLQWLAQAFEWTIPSKSDPTDREAIDALYETLDGLSTALRVPWVLHVVHGETFEAVADRCNVSVSTAKRRINEAQLLIENRLRRH
jgi:RNA polymerase sigma-70 factor (ECF subfamily)